MPRAGLDAEVVIGAASELADAEGLQAVTLARLAETLGVRPPSLYSHVAGLADIRRRLGLRALRELTVALQRAAGGRARADALGAVAVAYRKYATEHPGTYSAAQQAPDPSDAEAVDLARALVEVVIAALGGYGLDGDEAVHGVRVVRAALHGFVTLETAEGFKVPLSLDETFERLVAVLDRGLAEQAIAAA